MSAVCYMKRSYRSIADCVCLVTHCATDALSWAALSASPPSHRDSNRPAPLSIVKHTATWKPTLCVAPASLSSILWPRLLAALQIATSALRHKTSAAGDCNPTGRQLGCGCLTPIRTPIPGCETGRQGGKEPHWLVAANQSNQNSSSPPQQISPQRLQDSILHTNMFASAKKTWHAGATVFAPPGALDHWCCTVLKSQKTNLGLSSECAQAAW